MVKPYIFCDMDGVVVNLLSGVKKTLKKNGIAFNPKGVITYNFMGGDYGCDRQMVFQALGMTETFAEAPFYEFKDETLKKFKDKFTVSAYTLVADPEKARIRLGQIQKIGFRGEPQIGAMKFIPPVIGQLCTQTQTFLIEDNPATIKDWLDLTPITQALLVDHPYNQEVPAETPYGNRLKRVKNFQDAMEYLLKNFS